MASQAKLPSGQFGPNVSHGRPPNGAPHEPNLQNEGESNVIGAAEVVAVTAGVEGRERLVQ